MDNFAWAFQGVDERLWCSVPSTTLAQRTDAKLGPVFAAAWEDDLKFAVRSAGGLLTNK